MLTIEDGVSLAYRKEAVVGSVEVDANAVGDALLEHDRCGQRHVKPVLLQHRHRLTDEQLLRGVVPDRNLGAEVVHEVGDQEVGLGGERIAGRQRAAAIGVAVVSARADRASFADWPMYRSPSRWRRR